MRFSRFLESIGFGQSRCHNCHEPFFPQENTGKKLCGVCNKKFMPYTGEICKSCGVPIPYEEGEAKHLEKICAGCLKAAPIWNGFAYYGLYTGDLRNLLLRFKFGSELNLSILFAEFLLEICGCLAKPDFIVPIPQTHKHLGKRGYNQAFEIARSFAKESGFELNANALKRVKAGLPQEGLNAVQRRLNLENAFVSNEDIKGKTIWVIDDIMTTGSTYEAASKALFSYGAKKVYLLFLARTPIF